MQCVVDNALQVADIDGLVGVHVAVLPVEAQQHGAPIPPRVAAGEGHHLALRGAQHVVRVVLIGRPEAVALLAQLPGVLPTTTIIIYAREV